MNSVSALVLTPDAPPSAGSTALARPAALTPDCVAYELAPAATRALAAPLAELSRTVAAGDLLAYHVMPALDADEIVSEDLVHWQTGGFASTGVCLDLIFTDGGRLSDLRPTDHHGVVLDPESVGASQTLRVDQWNRVEVDLTACAGRTIERIDVRVADSAVGHTVRGWIDGVTVTSRPPRGPREAIDYVDTRRGTASTRDMSRGNTAPATAWPNGFHLLCPVTNRADEGWSYTYDRDVDVDGRPQLTAFAVSHAASPWLGDRGVLHLTPGRAWQPHRFDRAHEQASPHLYRVAFDDGVTASIAPTLHAGIVEFDFPAGERQVRVGFPVADALVDVDGWADTRVLRGWSDQQGSLADGSPRCHFALTFDPEPVAVRRVEGGDALIEFGDGVGPVTVRLASSWIGPEQADVNLREVLGHSLAEVSDRARDEWQTLLGAFALEGASDDESVSFYSSLYRLFLYPSIAHEVDESGTVVHRTPRTDDDPDGLVRPGALVVNNGFWDTYRTAWPAYHLCHPDRAAELIEGLLGHADAGGWMPRWTAPGGVDIMVGTSSDVVFADAIVKGVPLSRPLLAWETAVRNSTVPSPTTRFGRTGLRSGIFAGYVDRETHEGLSWSLESAFCDHAIAMMARSLRSQDDLSPQLRAELDDAVSYFESRATSYTRLFDPATGFRGREASGEFGEEFDPRLWGGDYTETNAWGMRFAVPHDPVGLGALLGGADELEAALDEYFRTPEHALPDIWGGYGRLIHEMTEARDVRMGQFAISNQPAHHVPYLYAYTRSPWKTQAITREALRRCFLGSEIGQGYPGDEDNGEMSAWYVLNALGLYPLAPGTPWYVITAPLFPSLTVDIPGRGRLTVRTSSASRSDVFIQSVTVDGEPWASPFIAHERIANGALIEVVLGPTPSTWGSAARELPSLTGPGVAPRVLDDAPRQSIAGDFPGWSELLDDRGDGEVAVSRGGSLVRSAPEPFVLEVYTLTAPDGGRAPASWRLEGSADGAQWSTLDERRDVVFAHPRQTRPFVPAVREPFAQHRIVFGEAGDLAQIEFLGSAS